jgi:ABC-type multidrug transport system fused ATPase/permease subunit
MNYVLERYKIPYLIVILCIFISVYATIQGTMFMKTLIDVYITPMLGSEAPDFGPLAGAIGRVAVFYLLGAVSAFVQARLMIYISQGTESTMVAVPDVTGHYVSDAQTMLSNFGLYAYITEMVSDTVEKGIVISQNIDPETKVQTGSAVTITVSAGKADGEDIVIEGDTSSVWKCNAQLNPPAGTSSGEELAVRITLTQEDETTTIFEGTTTFPYILNVEGKAGVGTGTVYVYLLDPSTWEVSGDPIVYDNVTFTKVE